MVEHYPFGAGDEQRGLAPDDCWVRLRHGYWSWNPGPDPHHPAHHLPGSPRVIQSEAALTATSSWWRSRQARRARHPTACCAGVGSLVVTLHCRKNPGTSMSRAAALFGRLPASVMVSAVTASSMTNAKGCAGHGIP